MKKIILTFLILLIFIIFPSPISFAHDKLIIGYYDDYPLIFRDDSGNPSGFSIDLMNEVLKKENYEFEYVYGTWAEMMEWLADGEIDVVIDILRNERRDEFYDFNEIPFFMSWGAVCVNDKYKVESIFDLEGLKIGYMDRDYYAVEKTGIIDKTDEFFLDVEYVSYDTYDDVFKAVNKNEVNAGIINKLTVNQIYEYNNIKETPLMFAASGIRIAVLEGKNKKIIEDVDKYLAIWQSDKNSIYYELYDYWFDYLVNNNLKAMYYENRFEIILLLFTITLIIVYLRMKLYFKIKKLNKVNKELKKVNEEVEINYNEVKILYNDVGLLANKFEKLTSFIGENMEVSQQSSEEFFLSELLRKSMELVEEADYGIVYNFNEDGELVVIDSVNIKRPNLKGINKSELIRFKGNVMVIRGFFNKVVNNLNKKSSKEIMKKEMKDSKEALLLTFRKKRKIFGGIVLEIEKDSKKSFKKNSKRIMNALRNIAESYFLNVSYHDANEIFQKELVLSMVQMLEIHDIYTKGHSEVVANYAKRLAFNIGLDKKKVDEIYWAGLVHDIGKVLVSKDIINKKGKLAIEEYEEIKKHPVFGYEALKESKTTENIAEYVLYHHERIDGDGYPEGLKGNEIPLESRIIAIADSFDAMVSNRTYKESISKEEALKEIKVNLDTQFDSKLGLKFIEMISREEK